MSQILICTMLTAVLSSGLPAGPTALTGPLAGTDHVVSGASPMAGTVSEDSGSGDPESGDSVAQSTGTEDAGIELAPRLRWPLPGSPTVARAFHPPAFRYGPGHRGVDLVTVAGAPVLAAEAGTVAFAGTVAGVGVVSVDHAGGLRTTYEPVSPTVTIGDRVTRGERIATVQSGHPGCPVAVCLHWGVLRGLYQGSPPQDRQYLDPLGLLASSRVRLLPTNGVLVGAGFSAGGSFQHFAPEP